MLLLSHYLQCWIISKAVPIPETDKNISDPKKPRSCSTTRQSRQNRRKKLFYTDYRNLQKTTIFWLNSKSISDTNGLQLYSSQEFIANSFD